MEKIKKVFNLTVIIILLCQNISFGTPERNSALRPPIKDDTYKAMEKYAALEALTKPFVSYKPGLTKIKRSNPLEQAIEVIRSFIFDNPHDSEEAYEYLKMMGMLKEDSKLRDLFEDIAKNILLAMGFDETQIQNFMKSNLVLYIPIPKEQEKLEKLQLGIKHLYNLKNGIKDMATSFEVYTTFGRYNISERDLEDVLAGIMPEDIHVFAIYMILNYMKGQSATSYFHKFVYYGQKNILFIDQEASRKELRYHVAAETGHAILHYFTGRDIKLCRGVGEAFDVLSQRFAGYPIPPSPVRRAVVKVIARFTDSELHELENGLPKDAGLSTSAFYPKPSIADSRTDNVVAKLMQPRNRYVFRKLGLSDEAIDEFFKKDRLFVSHAVGVVLAHRLLGLTDGSILKSLAILGLMLQHREYTKTFFSDHDKFLGLYRYLVRDSSIAGIISGRFALMRVSVSI